MLTQPEIVIEHVTSQVPREWGGRLDVMEVWPQLQRSFRKAQRVGLGECMDEVAILQALCEGTMELLTARRGEDLMGALILQFNERPKGRCCTVVAALFNSLRDIPLWSPAMNEYLRDHAERWGCYTVEANARDGSVPVMTKLGWRRKATVMEMT